MCEHPRIQFRNIQVGVDLPGDEQGFIQERSGVPTSSIGFRALVPLPSVEDPELNLREVDLRREAITPRWSSAIDRAAPVSLWFVFTSSSEPTSGRVNASPGEQRNNLP